MGVHQIMSKRRVKSLHGRVFEVHNENWKKKS